MGIISRLGGFRPSPLTGQPQSGGMLTQPGVSPIAATFARNVGGLLGRDMRTTEEKILDAQKDIDTSTASGLIQSIEARLQFETDPNKRNSLNMQLNQLRRQQAADARQRQADAKANQERERKANAKLRTIEELKKYGLSEDAERLEKDIWTTSQASQLLGSEIRRQKTNLETLESQREYIEIFDLAEDPLFQNLLDEKTTEPLSSQLFKALAEKADVNKAIQATVSTIESLPENDNKQIAIDLLKAGGISTDKAVNLATDKVETKNYSTNDFVDAETGEQVASVLRDGVLHSWSENQQEFVDTRTRPLKNAPPEIKRAPKITKADREYAAKFALIYEDSKGAYGALDRTEKTQFENLVISYMREMADTSGRSESTHVQEAIDKVLKEHFTTKSGLVSPSYEFNPATPNTPTTEEEPTATPAAPTEIIVVTQDLLDRSPSLRAKNVKVGDRVEVSR